MNTPLQSQLGKQSAYVDKYDASLLFPIPRAAKRGELGIAGAPTFFGADLWTAFELSWLNPRGKPQVAIAHITVPSESINIIESKSFKLYLNSFNSTVFDDAVAVSACMKADLNAAVWQEANAVLGDTQKSPIQSSVGVKILLPEMFDREPVHELDGLNLDRLDIECKQTAPGSEPTPELLMAAFDEAPVSEVFTSNLLKSNCLVTGQPDWGSLRISYEGPQIDQAALLQYIVSFRNHNEFHEQCVERIFMDIWTRCKPIKLSIYARYTRRGGLDINPFRTSYPQAVPLNIRTARQ
jgi:7-cyano-7-deazaguanine reductase